MEKNFKLYDSINTMTVRWLIYNNRLHNKPIGIKNFSRKNPKHMWLLYMIENYSIYNNYCDYYIQGNFFSYLYLKYIKGFKHLKYYRSYIDVLLIEADIFIKEITSSFDQNSNIIEEIYNEFWGK